MSYIPRQGPPPAAPPIPWRKWPGRIIVSRPPCTGAPGCKMPPSVWIACACGQPFAACGAHRRSLELERAAHRVGCQIVAAKPAGRGRCGRCARDAVVTELPSTELQRDGRATHCWDELGCRRRAAVRAAEAPRR